MLDDKQHNALLRVLLDRSNSLLQAIRDYQDAKLRYDRYVNLHHPEQPTHHQLPPSYGGIDRA